jgi:hypothetical protein
MAADWHVMYQNQRPEVTAQGRLVQVRDIHYRIDTGPAAGQEDTVTVPDTEYTVDNVRSQIQYAVDIHQQVAAL